jgi:hypothetical protein
MSGSERELRPLPPMTAGATILAAEEWKYIMCWQVVVVALRRSFRFHLVVELLLVGGDTLHVTPPDLFLPPLYTFWTTSSQCKVRLAVGIYSEKVSLDDRKRITFDGGTPTVSYPSTKLIPPKSCPETTFSFRTFSIW